MTSDLPEGTRPSDWAAAWRRSRTHEPAVRTVDVHSHLMIPESAELVAPHFRPEDDPRTFYSAPETVALNKEFQLHAREKYTDPAVRLADMDLLGIDLQLVAVAPFHYYYWAEETLASRVASLQNDRIAEVVASNPSRFAGVGTLPLAHPDAAIREARRIHQDLGFPAVQLGSEAHGVDLDDARFEGLWSQLEELGLVVILHPAGFTDGSRLTEYYLVNVIGMPLSSTLTVTRLILGGVFERHPGLRMLVVHGGGYLSFYAARTDHAFRHRPEMRRHIDRLPSEYLAQLYFDTTVFDPTMVEQLVQRYGADHVMVGTDYPFDMGLTDPLGLLDDARLTRGEREQIAGRSAAALFHLGDQSNQRDLRGVDGS